MFTVQEVVSAVGGSVLSGTEEHCFTGISIDSRAIQPGDLFVCIQGDRFDGHDFFSHAVTAGATGILMSEKKEWNEKRISQSIKDRQVVAIMTDNTLDALGNLAHFHRERFGFPVIGITGSNGKTTTKEITASILNRTYHALKNKGNLNNLVGVPLSLLRINANHNAAVIEMGMNRTGEIKRLCAIARPTIGIVTNVCDAHREQFSSLDEIKREKQELIRSLDRDGTAILNSDDPLVYEMNRLVRGKVLTYGTGSSAMIKAEDIEKREVCRYSFSLRIGKKAVPVHLPIPGYHNIYNALSAAAVGVAMDVDMNNIKQGIESCVSPPMRTEIVEEGNVIIINDAYNANQASVEAALEILSQSTVEGRRVFVFGDMLELGEVSRSAHISIGRKVVTTGVDILITAGEWAQLTAKEAIASGMSGEQVYTCGSVSEASRVTSDCVKSGDSVLVKGSRGMKMEEVIERLLHSPAINN